MNFKAAILALADSDDVTNAQERKLRRLAGNKRRLKACEERCELEARRDGRRLRALAGGGGYGADDTYGFDWSALLEFIKQLLPVILQLIALFNV